jgi:uncharacterized protein YyaL (SSP411 family)
MPNRLARERSPYLLQHANNPVDWYAWGDEAFARARSEDKPIFLSIGYSTCHWCHVMEHESFESAAIADALNRDFVSIKVDREERPDIDRVYMTFVQATTGAGGWPMSVFLTPELKPFFGGTYFPPSSRWGRPGFSEVVAEIVRAWRDDRGRLVNSSATIVDRLRSATGSDDVSGDRGSVAGISALETGISQFAQSYDPRHGGFGGAPKFPRPSELLFLLHAHAVTGNFQARQVALGTLEAMARGGIRDQIGGGFHRYSVDAQWRVPHFEKMLYDQAQLVLAYLDAYQVSGDVAFAAVAEDTLEYVAREMTAPNGAFHSAEDADSLPVDSAADAHGSAAGRASAAEKREGAFYVWTAAEIDRLIGDDAAIVRRRFGVEDKGNALADPQGEFVGQNILYVAQSFEEIAARSSTSVADVESAIDRARLKLYEARCGRPRPHLDDKLVTAWNGLMIAAYARAARVLVTSPRRQDWRRIAERAGNVLRSTIWNSEEGRVFRRYRDGEAAVDGFCEDYACLVWGLLELFQATGSQSWLDWAVALTSTQTQLFWDERDGGWFSTTGEDASVLLRMKEDYDGAEPAAASVTVRNLLTLGHLLGHASLVDRARRTLERYGAEIGRVARVMPLMLSNVALWHAEALQVVVAGDPQASDTGALESVVAAIYSPGLIQVPVGTTGASDGQTTALPWLAAMRPRDGRATAYVCRAFTCEEPITDPALLSRQLHEASRPRLLG